MRRPAAALALVLAATSCGHSSYEKTRERWTRDVRLTKALDTSLSVWATLFTPEFTSAYVKRRTEMFKLTGAEQAALERQVRDDAGSGYYFFVAAAAHDYNWVDFEQPRSVWRVALLNSKGEQVAASRIELERRVTATVVELFPYVTEFYRTYTVRFPLTLPDGRPLLRGGSEEELTLRFAGPLGHAELRWKLP
jgi:hypothetical protein